VNEGRIKVAVVVQKIFNAGKSYSNGNDESAELLASN
jgi:hypothetical protein